MIDTLPIVFFFYCHADRLVLHSFPTRRSSDLLLPSGAGSAGAVAALPRRDRGGWRVAGRRGQGARRGEDRKSTRLNSSHGYISYAVFCLKKKTTSQLYVLMPPNVGGFFIGRSY